MYIQGFCYTNNDPNTLAEGLNFLKLLGKDTYVQEAIALVYLKLAKLSYKEDPEAKQVQEDEKNDQTEFYLQ